MVRTREADQGTIVMGGSNATMPQTSIAPTVINIQNVITFTSSSRPYFEAVVIWSAKHTVTAIDAEVIKCDERDTRDAQQRSTYIEARKRLAGHRVTYERNEDAVRSGKKRALPRRGLDEPECLEHVPESHENTHRHTYGDVTHVEMTRDPLMEQHKHDERRRYETTCEQRERRNQIEGVFHDEERISPYERHGSKHELPKERRARTSTTQGGTWSTVFDIDRSIRPEKPVGFFRGGCATFKLVHAA